MEHEYTIYLPEEMIQKMYLSTLFYDGEFTLEDVVELVKRTAAEGGRMLREPKRVAAKILDSAIGTSFIDIVGTDDNLMPVYRSMLSVPASENCTPKENER